MTIAVIVIVVIVVLLVVFAITSFNRLRRADIGAQEALGGIDVQLTRRADLIPNLVNTVKGYAAHEKSVLEDVTAARTGVAAAAKGDDVHAKAAADQELQNALVRVDAVAEAYPDLKASANFVELQKQLADTESQLSFARQYYNDAVAKLNNQTQTFPSLLFVGMAGVRKREFYEAPEAHELPPTVDFGAGAPVAPAAADAQAVAPAPETPAVPPSAEAAPIEAPVEQEPPAEGPHPTG